MMPDELPEGARTRLLNPEIMGPPIVWLASDQADGVHNERITAAEFDDWLARRSTRRPPCHDERIPLTTATFEETALARLRSLTGNAGAGFRDGQLEAIRDLAVDRARVLCVQRTGWGKSAVYFVATALLREAGAGPTLIVSPLLALMRNQIDAAQRLRLRAHTINSTNREEWDMVREQLRADTIDLLLISPERLNNPQFRESMLPLFAASVGLLVIDEAHCISDWGHDFRPDYRRVKDMLDALAPDAAVLGTTATANDRVVADVVEQLAASNAVPLRTYRGSLARTSLRLEVLELPRPAQRLAWLVEHLPKLPGSGIVYTLTKRDADQVAGFLNANGIAALPYSGEHETDARVDTEERLLRNDIKAVVATSALGMGYDKADLSFVVHYQAPGSVVSYYQQVGRAGRGVEHADVVLLRGAEDRRIQDFFIAQAFPSRDRVDAVLAELEFARRAGPHDKGADGDRQPRYEPDRGDAEDPRRRGRRDPRRQPLAASPHADWTYDGERYAQVTALRRTEQRAMARLRNGRPLPDAHAAAGARRPRAEDCGRCSTCTGPRYADPLDPFAGRAGAALPPFEPGRARGQEDGAGRVWHACGRSLRMCASSPAGRSRVSAMAAGGRWSSAASAMVLSIRSSSPGSPICCAARTCAPTGSRAVPSVRLGDTLDSAGRAAGR